MCVFKLSYVALGILQIYSIHIFFFRTIPSLVNSNPHCKTPRWRWKDRWSQQTSAGGGDSQDQGRPMCAETWLLSSTTCSRRVAITYLKSAQNYMLIGYVQEKVWLSSGLGQDCDRIWAEHPAHTSRFGCQKLSCYVGELAATIGEGSTSLLWLKLFIWPNSILKWFTFCTFRRFCGIWCQCCYWRFAPAALWQRVLIFCINMLMVRVKLQTFSRSVLAFQKLLFHPLNVNKGLDMTMVAPLFSTRYPCHATANPGSYDCHQVSTLCIKSGPVVVGVGRKDGLGSTLGAIIFHLATAWNHSLQFGSVWWFAQTFLGEIKWARVLQDTQHHVRCRLWPPASASWTSEVRDMPARMQRRRKHTTLFLERHQMMCCLDVNTEVLDVNTGDVLSVFTPSFVHRWRAISGILARPAVHFKQPAYHIAVHVRRGDVLVNRFGSKFANDHIFINVARTVQAMLPKAHVHIFSTTFAHTSKEKTYKESQFDIYKKSGVSSALGQSWNRWCMMWLILLKLMFSFAPAVRFHKLYLFWMQNAFYVHILVQQAVAP